MDYYGIIDKIKSDSVLWEPIVLKDTMQLTDEEIGVWLQLADMNNHEGLPSLIIVDEIVGMVRERANSGNAGAQNNLGEMYFYGLGIEQNYEEAAKWHRLAAEQGFAPAQCSLGDMYEEGLGIEQNYEEAVKWYRLAAVQGHADAQCSLGCVYKNDLGG